MSGDDLADRLKEAWRAANPGPHPVAFIVVLLVGLGGGWYAHSHFWKSSSLDYALIRSGSLAAQCKGIDGAEQKRLVEARLNKPSNLFTIDDKMIALDYLLDRIDALHCLRNRGR